MSVKDQALAQLRELEGKLRDLLAEAAREGEYKQLPYLTSVARAVGELAARMEAGSPLTGGAARPASPAAKRSGASGTKRRKKKRRRRKSRKKAGYPKFLRQGSNLVKIGYSKKRGEYSHRAPRAVVSLVADAVARAGAGGRLFTSDEFIPVADPKGKLEIPTYQAYMALAWMKHEGLIVAEGRQGYRTAATNPLAQAAQDRWDALATR